jgi:hypothetical protein
VKTRGVLDQRRDQQGAVLHQSKQRLGHGVSPFFMFGQLT